MVTMALCLDSLGDTRAGFAFWAQFLSRENSIAQANLSFERWERGSSKSVSGKVDGI